MSPFAFTPLYLVSSSLGIGPHVALAGMLDVFAPRPKCPAGLHAMLDYQQRRRRRKYGARYFESEGLQAMPPPLRLPS